ncbi:hypothetical protein LX36DRAFT_109181 [Colletotrichum falcatum]|nr:hypothetical protein LX36DRAFT_109181 [Colletotrichum falcatum]
MDTGFLPHHYGRGRTTTSRSQNKNPQRMTKKEQRQIRPDEKEMRLASRHYFQLMLYTVSCWCAATMAQKFGHAVVAGGTTVLVVVSRLSEHRLRALLPSSPAATSEWVPKPTSYPSAYNTRIY